jgi:hypothetical protein
MSRDKNRRHNASPDCCARRLTGLKLDANPQDRYATWRIFPFIGLPRDQFRYFGLNGTNLFGSVKGVFQWGGKDSNLRPTDYESRWKPSIEANLAR